MRPKLTRRERIRRHALRAAQREHARLGTRFDRPIDIFGVIEGANIWLMFQRMEGLFGAYQRLDDAAGIIINANHPSSLQRFTAAHEYGHHVLGHERSLDTEEQIQGGVHADVEIAAHSFAAEFLMPLQLVNRALRGLDLPLKPKTVSPRHVYQLSLALGGSYTATITQLSAHGKIAPQTARDLRKQRPITIKEDLAGEKPEQARADVWVLEQDQSGQEFILSVEDEVHVLLPETPSSGYIWMIREPSQHDHNGAGLTLVKEVFEPTPTGAAYGASGVHRVVLRASEPGSHVLRLEKRRRWESDAPPTATFEARLEAKGRPTGETIRGLSDRQKPLLALTV